MTKGFERLCEKFVSVGENDNKCKIHTQKNHKESSTILEIGSWNVGRIGH